jgi:myosin heavy subunit
MIAFDHLCEAAILHNVKQRFENKLIYTFVSDVLLSVNPYERYADVYSDATMTKYLNLRVASDEAPHVFATASLAYNAMMKDRAPQSILVSGESGSGKTEATRWILSCISKLSERGASHAANSERRRGIEEALLRAGPLLEAFGNARTVRNTNSSRFGKYIEVIFDENGVITGAALQHFLLEKSRVAQLAAGERNFHVFYQLVRGASSDERKRWGLLGACEDYRLLKAPDGASTTIAGVDDVAAFRRLKESMTVLGFEQREIELTFGTLTMILNIGNLSFVDKQGVAGACEFGDRTSLHAAAEFIGCADERLADAFLCKPFRTAAGARTSSYTIPLTRDEAGSTRDALAAATYERLFDDLVRRIARALAAPQDSDSGAVALSVKASDDTVRVPADKRVVGGSAIVPRGGTVSRAGVVETSTRTKASTLANTRRDTASDARDRGGTVTSTLRGAVHEPAPMSIGVLDVFGFEALAHNSLEQLLINYANERLQALFTAQVLRAEQDEYKTEVRARWCAYTTLLTLLYTCNRVCRGKLCSTVIIPSCWQCSSTSLLACW